MIKEKIVSFFKENYTAEPILVRAPGRVNIIGEHTDYNLGYVLPASIEKSIYFALGPTKDAKVTIQTFLNYPEKISFDLNGDSGEFKSFWGHYFKAILQILKEKKYSIKGVNCVFGGDIPIGSGLSSSAALCCGFIYAISKLYELHLPRPEIALIAQSAEHRIGLNCGLMDQYAILYGKKGNAVFLDCSNLQHQYIPINIKGYSWILLNSNIKHKLAVDSAYNDRRKSCENVVLKIQGKYTQVQSLRDVSLSQLTEIKNEIPNLDYVRALYVIEENARVLKMVDALQNGDALKTGNLLLEGHWSMSRDFDISTPEIDYLVSISQEQEGVVGSRMMGGGFGGCTINLIKDEFETAAVNKICAAYHKETRNNAEYYHLNIGDSIQLCKTKLNERAN